MKVLAINGSPRKGGNTELMIKEVFKSLEAGGAETELIHIGGNRLMVALLVANAGKRRTAGVISRMI